ncbi:hypothetical protein ACFE04_013796 [Oxalis oulophora]
MRSNSITNHKKPTLKEKEGYKKFKKTSSSKGLEDNLEKKIPEGWEFVPASGKRREFYRCPQTLQRFNRYEEMILYDNHARKHGLGIHYISENDVDCPKQIKENDMTKILVNGEGCHASNEVVDQNKDVDNVAETDDIYGTLEPISGVKIPQLTDEEQNGEHKIEDDYVFQDPCPSPDILYQWAPNEGGVVHEKGLLPQDLPPWLSKITQRICEESGLFPSAINHVLINEYLPDQGIMHHQDGPAYFPVAAILSLGSPAVMDFIPHSRLTSDASKDSYDPLSVLLMPCNYLHGIKDSALRQYDGAVNEIQTCDTPIENAAGMVEDRDLKIIHRTETRISLTCRLVLKVHKNLFKF